MKIAGIILLVIVLSIIVFTWGSIASATLTLGMLLAGAYVLWHRLVPDRGDDDYWMEES